MGLQVRVLSTVTEENDGNGKVKKRLTGWLVSTDVLVQVSADWAGWLSSSWSVSGWQLLVEGDKLGHSLGVWVGTDVLSLV